MATEKKTSQNLQKNLTYNYPHVGIVCITILSGFVCTHGPDCLHMSLLLIGLDMESVLASRSVMTNPVVFQDTHCDKNRCLGDTNSPHDEY